MRFGHPYPGYNANCQDNPPKYVILEVTALLFLGHLKYKNKTVEDGMQRPQARNRLGHEGIIKETTTLQNTNMNSSHHVY